MLGERVCWVWFGIRNKVKPIMLLTRFRSLLVVLGLLSGSSAAIAQQGGILKGNLPFPPGDITSHNDYRLFEHADLSSYGNGPKAKEGLFFQYDRLMWSVSNPKATVIGNPSAEGVLPLAISGQVLFGPFLIGAPNNSNLTIPNLNSLDNTFIQTDYAWGNRYEFGYVDDNRGWMIGVSRLNDSHRSITQLNGNIVFNDPGNLTSRYLDLNNDGVDDDLNGNGIFGNNGPYNADLLSPVPGPNGTTVFVPIGTFITYSTTDAQGNTVTFTGPAPADGVLDSYAGPDSGDLRKFPLIFSTLFAENHTRVSEVEVNSIQRWDTLHNGSHAEWLFGLRYTNVHDNFFLLGQNAGGSVQDFRLQNIVNNYMVGPQVGLRWYTDQGPWRINTEARFAAMANFQEAKLNGNFASVGGLLTTSSDPLAGANFLSFIDNDSSIQFSPFGEIRLDVSYKLSNTVSLRAGYTGQVIGGVTRASNRVTYDLPGTFADGTTTRGIQINDDHRLESFFLSGVNFGIEINR